MKAQIHPKWYKEAKVACACGNEFVVGATQPELTVEICYACHPFYTGKMKFVDTAGRVDSFVAKRKMAQKTHISKAEKRHIKKMKKIEKEMERPDSLAELRKSQAKKKKK